MRLKLKGNNCVYNYPVSDWLAVSKEEDKPKYTDYRVKMKMKLMNLKNHNENINLKFV